MEDSRRDKPGGSSRLLFPNEHEADTVKPLAVRCPLLSLPMGLLAFVRM
jgi:hypothetical protein